MYVYQKRFDQTHLFSPYFASAVYNIQVKHIQEDENTLIKYKMEIQKAYKLGKYYSFSQNHYLCCLERIKK